MLFTCYVERCQESSERYVPYSVIKKQLRNMRIIRIVLEQNAKFKPQHRQYVASNITFTRQRLANNHCHRATMDDSESTILDYSHYVQW